MVISLETIWFRSFNVAIEKPYTNIPSEQDKNKVAPLGVVTW